MEFIVKNFIVGLVISSPFIIYFMYKLFQEGIKYLLVKNKKECIKIINDKYPTNKRITLPNDEDKFWKVVLEIGDFKRNPLKVVNVYFNNQEPITILKEEFHIRGKNGEREIVETKTY